MNDTTASPAKYTALLPNAFRDTAFSVASLADNATSPGFTSFRAKCVAQVDALGRELRAAGHLPDVVRDATYAQCALLDETALAHLKGPERDAWEREPLQVEAFKSNDAGYELIDRIQQRLAEPRPNLALLHIFNSVLGLGFKGKFALSGADARLELMRALDQRVGESAAVDTSGTVVLTENLTSRWSANVSPLGWVIGAVVVAGLVYLALGQWLTASIARIPV
ncbi:DotU family type IV/VI secretion system protein [Caballeronia sp. KNU42]